MELIDTHTHLFVNDFINDIDSVVKRAKEAGVVKCYLPAIDRSEMENLLALEKTDPIFFHAMAGLHPCSVNENYKEEIAYLEELLTTRDFAGIGETGLDFYWDKTYAQQQIESLEIHAEWAIQYNRPIILHTRNSTTETIEVMKKYVDRGIRGIFHCFSGNLEQAKEIIEMGFYLGIGGVVTFKNSGLQEIVKEIDLEHIVLETDSPYLAPAPFRGKRNESSYLSIIAQKISEVKEIPLSEVAAQTTKNAQDIFHPH